MQNDTPEYFEKLPQEVQSFIMDGVWQDRTVEIAKKYSLNPEQSDLLIDEVLYILIGLEEPAGFQERLVKELSISVLLASQLIDEIDRRVFQYALQAVQPKQKEEKKATETQKSVASEAPVPEIRPEIIPAVKAGEVVHFNPAIPEKSSVPPQVTQTPAPHTDIKPTENTVISFKPVSKPVQEKTPEVRKVFLHSPVRDQIQRPVSVPRFTVTPTPEEQKTATPEPIGNPVVASQAVTTPPTAPISPVQQQTPKKYDVDPYLEPVN